MKYNFLANNKDNKNSGSLDSHLKLNIPGINKTLPNGGYNNTTNKIMDQKVEIYRRYLLKEYLVRMKTGITESTNMVNDRNKYYINIYLDSLKHSMNKKYIVAGKNSLGKKILLSENDIFPETPLFEDILYRIYRLVKLIAYNFVDYDVCKQMMAIYNKGVLSINIFVNFASKQQKEYGGWVDIDKNVTDTQLYIEFIYGMLILNDDNRMTKNIIDSLKFEPNMEFVYMFRKIKNIDLMDFILSGIDVWLLNENEFFEATNKLL